MIHLDHYAVQHYEQKTQLFFLTCQNGVRNQRDQCPSTNFYRRTSWNAYYTPILGTSKKSVHQFETNTILNSLKTFFFFLSKTVSKQFKIQNVKTATLACPLTFYDTSELTKALSHKPVHFSLGCLTIFSLRKAWLTTWNIIIVLLH